MRFRFLPALLAVVLVFPTVAAELPAPVLRAHAHNDYEHKRPLVDALEHGFCSVEADIWLVGGKLLVAHNERDVSPAKTLQSLYLDPLRERIRTHGGKVFGTEPGFTLLIDVKSDASATYAALRSVLLEYRDILTSFRDGKIFTNAVTVIITGNRAMEAISQDSDRMGAIDGRPADLDGTTSGGTIAWISENWNTVFKWRGQGTLPEAEKVKLRQMTDRAHAQGRRVRFWNTPDKPAFWRELLAGGVDILNADDLAGLETFLRSEKAP